jgi:hypothetical protein
VKKLISIGIVLALLVTFLVPVAVGAQDNCATCGPGEPCSMQIPPCKTDTVGGALLWTLLGTTAIMGKAVGDTTSHIAGTLGCYVDKLAAPTFGLMGVVATGLGGLLDGLGTMIGMTSIIGPIATMLKSISTEIQKFIT